MRFQFPWETRGNGNSRKWKRNGHNFYVLFVPQQPQELSKSDATKIIHGLEEKRDNIVELDPNFERVAKVSQIIQSACSTYKEFLKGRSQSMSRTILRFLRDVLCEWPLRQIELNL